MSALTLASPAATTEQGSTSDWVDRDIKGRERERGSMAVPRMLAGLAAEEVELRLELGARLRDAGRRILAFYLADMADRRLHRVLGYRTTALFASARLEMSHRRALELIGLGHALATLPDIDRALCARRIGWSKAVLLSRVVSPIHEAEWLARALDVSCRQLSKDVRRARPGGPPPKGLSDKGLPEVRLRVTADVCALTHKKWELAKDKLAAERGAPVSDAECIDILAELILATDEDGTTPGRTPVSGSLYRIVVDPISAPEYGETACACIACDAETIESGDDVPDGHHGEQPSPRAAIDTPTIQTAANLKTPDRKTPPAMRRRVIARDGGCCRACGSRHRLMVHHIQYRSQGGRTNWHNLITLCAGCHALVHEDLLVLIGQGAHLLEQQDDVEQQRVDQRHVADPKHIRFVDAHGRSLHEPGHRIGPAALQSLMPPPAACGLSLPAVLRDAADDYRGMGTDQFGRSLGKLPSALFSGTSAEDATVMAQSMAQRAGVRFVQADGRSLQTKEDWLRVTHQCSVGSVVLVCDAEQMGPVVSRAWCDWMDRSSPDYALVLSSEQPSEISTELLGWIKLNPMHAGPDPLSCGQHLRPDLG